MKLFEIRKDKLVLSVFYTVNYAVRIYDTTNISFSVFSSKFSYICKLVIVYMPVSYTHLTLPTT